MIGQQRAPGPILARLREIDPKADVVHLDGREWLLGVRAENHPARDRVEAQLRHAVAAPNELADAGERALIGRQMACEIEVLQLCANGFRPIQLYQVDESRPTGYRGFFADGPRAWTWGEVVEDFRLRDFNWRTRREAAFGELRDEVSTERGERERTARFMDYISARARDVYQRVFAKAKSVAVPHTFQKSTETPA